MTIQAVCDRDASPLTPASWMLITIEDLHMCDWDLMCKYVKLLGSLRLLDCACSI